MKWLIWADSGYFLSSSLQLFSFSSLWGTYWQTYVPLPVFLNSFELYFRFGSNMRRLIIAVMAALTVATVALAFIPIPVIVIDEYYNSYTNHTITGNILSQSVRVCILFFHKLRLLLDYCTSTFFTLFKHWLQSSLWHACWLSQLLCLPERGISSPPKNSLHSARSLSSDIETSECVEWGEHFLRNHRCYEIYCPIVSCA